MKKVILVTESLGSGGAERQLTGLAASLTRIGYQCTVVTWINKNFYASFLAENNVKHILLKPKGRIDRVKKLASIFRHEYPDVVISFLPVGNETAALASLLVPIKLIVSERSFTTDWGWRRKLTNLLYLRASFIVANSNNESQNICSHCPHLASRTLTIPNYVDIKRFFINPIKTRNTHRPISFIGVGRIIPSKNIHNILKALAKVKIQGYNFTFDWYGTSSNKSYLAEIKQQIADLQLENFFFLRGECKTIENAYRQADFMCMPSILEGYPNVLLEAMASGLPVAVSNVCEHPYIIEEGINGFLFDPHNIDSIASALIKTINLDKAEIDRISATNRRKVIENNSIQSFCKKYTALIQRING